MKCTIPGVFDAPAKVGDPSGVGSPWRYEVNSVIGWTGVKRPEGG
jgi:hypothetical protein